MKKPCKECPFRKDSFKGYLGGFTVEETLAVANSDQSFICHLERENKNDKSECAGRLLYATKTCKQFRNPLLEEERKHLGRYTEDILGFDFKEHHKQII
jgi:hypothetical protein